MSLLSRGAHSINVPEAMGNDDCFTLLNVFFNAFLAQMAIVVHSAEPIQPIPRQLQFCQATQIGWHIPP